MTWRLWRRRCGWQAPIGPWQPSSQRPACHTAGCTSSCSCRQVHACLMKPPRWHAVESEWQGHLPATLYIALGVLMRSPGRQPRPLLFCAGTTALPAVDASQLLPSATEQWTAVLAASTSTPPAGHTENRPETQQEIPAGVAATKAADIAHSQSTMGGVEIAHPHHAAHQPGTPQAVRQRGTLAFDKQSAGDNSLRTVSSSCCHFTGCITCSGPIVWHAAS